VVHPAPVFRGCQETGPMQIPSSSRTRASRSAGVSFLTFASIPIQPRPPRVKGSVFFSLPRRNSRAFGGACVACVPARAALSDVRKPIAFPLAVFADLFNPFGKRRSMQGIDCGQSLQSLVRDDELIGCSRAAGHRCVIQGIRDQAILEAIVARRDASGGGLLELAVLRGGQ